MTIPVRNVYYLLCYAWDALDQAALADVDADDARDVLELLSMVLAEATADLLRRGLDRGYLEHELETRSPRGRLRFEPMVSRAMRRTGHVVCTIDELTHDVLHNRILAATLTQLGRVWELQPRVRERVYEVAARLPPLSPLTLDRRVFRRVQLHRNNQVYGFLMNICELVTDRLVPDEQGRGLRFRDFVRDPMAMARLFEAFVRNFARRHTRWRVARRALGWDGGPADEASSGWLPGMQTDTTLELGEQCLLIETKFYGQPLQQRAGRATVRSSHLYQLMAYLRNLAASRRRLPEGLLLYAQPERSVPSLSFELWGHRVRVEALDLDTEWQNIEQRVHCLLTASRA